MRLSQTLSCYAPLLVPPPTVRYVILSAAEPGHWITLDSGLHVFLDKEGTITRGPAALLQRSVGELRRKHGYEKAQPGARSGAVVGTPTGAKGSRYNPVACGSNIDKAARLISQGKHVTLNQPDEISTLVAKIGREAEAARAAGQPIPNFDIAKISVPGTNLFAQDNINVPRVEMPQFAGTVEPGSRAARMLPPGADLNRAEVDLAPQFIQHLRDLGIDIKEVRVATSFLRASQSEIDGGKVGAMANAMDAGRVPEAPIFVTRDNYVLDGHHRWAAQTIRDLRDNHPGDIYMPVHKLNIDIGRALTLGREFGRKWGLRQRALGK